MTKSVAVKFDLYDNAGEGNNSTGIYSGGAMPTQPSFPFDNGIDLHAGHPLLVTMRYEGGTLTVTVHDTVTAAESSRAYAIDIPQVVGGANAYIGFTAGTGGASAIQSIQNWSYASEGSSTPLSIDFSGGFSDVSQLALNGASAATGGQLRLTNARAQTASVFTRTTLPVGRFNTKFTPCSPI
jgi:hypothetical protein